MRTLRLIGLSPDSRSVVFTDDAGVEYAVPADDRLRAALRGDRARLGQLEIDMESALRPRDIQARIRSGEAPESVAALAGVPVERITAYCVPVLAERRHVAELAGRSHVRRATADGATRRLEDVIAERLRGRSISPASAEWDAWRRDDDRWTVQVSYHSGESVRSASFVFDLAGRYSLADDDEAKWLTGERQQTRKGPQPRESSRAGERRLSTVPTGEDLLTLSEAQVDLDGWIDRMESVSPSQPAPDEVYDREADDRDDDDDRDDEDRADTEPVVSSGPDHWAYTEFEPGEVAGEHASPTPSATADQDATADHDDVPAPADLEPSDDLTAVVRAVREAGSKEAELPAAEAPPQRRRRTHATVPSWDEIMLGGRRGER